MHYHLEIIMPPTNNVDDAITKILEPFDENQNEGESNKHSFWDWWVIGGRYSGQHIIAKYDPSKLDDFYKDLKGNKVTVSGLVFGKEELSPASQIPLVDSLWQDHFPEEDGPCPLFKHSGDQYQNDYTNVCQMRSLPEHLSCSRIIITDSEFKPALMLETDYWNGVSWNDSSWDGTVKSALAMYDQKMDNYRQEWREKNKIESNWLLVTVDYHT